VLHACSKVNALRHEIERFSFIYQSHYNSKKNILITLKTISRKHMKLIRFSKNIQDIFSYVSLFHIFFLTLMQVISGYMLIDVSTHKFIKNI
jgi:hypothetical protein